MKRLLALLAVIAACVGLTTAPASAERVTGRDARADVAHGSKDDRWARAARPSADLVRYAVRYGDRRISAVLRYRDLKPRGVFSASVFLAYPGDSGREAGGLGVLAKPGDRAGTSSYDGERPCATRHRIDYRRDVVRLSMPARCIGRLGHIDASALSLLFSLQHPGLWMDVAPSTYRGDPAGPGQPSLVRVRRG